MASQPAQHCSEHPEDTKSCGILLYEMLFGYGSYEEAVSTYGTGFPQAFMEPGEQQSWVAREKVSRDCKEVLMGLLTPKESKMTLKDVLNTTWAKNICVSSAWRKHQKALISYVLTRAHSGEIQTPEEISRSVASCSFGSFDDIWGQEHMPID